MLGCVGAEVADAQDKQATGVIIENAALRSARRANPPSAIALRWQEALRAVPV
jgi:hypothetical protein